MLRDATPNEFPANTSDAQASIRPVRRGGAAKEKAGGAPTILNPGTITYPFRCWHRLWVLMRFEC